MRIRKARENMQPVKARETLVTQLNWSCSLTLVEHVTRVLQPVKLRDEMTVRQSYVLSLSSIYILLQSLSFLFYLGLLSQRQCSSEVFFDIFR